MPTAIGVIFFFLGAYFFLRKQDALLGLLIVSSIFQASYAVHLGKRGIQPYYLVATLIIIRGMLNRLLGLGRLRSLPQSRWLLSFVALAIASAFICPYVFAGIPVYDPLLGIDDGLLFRPPLSFNFNNVTQACFLLWHLATAYSLMAIPFSSGKTRQGYLCAFYLVLLCVVGQSVCQLTGIPFPDSILRTNPDIWDLATQSPGAARKPGTFLEPSFAGAFFVLYCVGFIAEYLAGKGSAKRVALALVGSGMVTSSGSLLTLGVATSALVLHYSPIRLPWYISLTRVKRIAWILVVVLAPLLLTLLLSANYRDTFLESTVSKQDTGSFFNRTASDLYALQLVIRTYGLGVGFGSNRSSSFITSIASTVGVLGLLIYGTFYYKLLAGLSAKENWLKWAGFGLMLNMCIDVPDVTFPVFQFALLLAISFQVNSNVSNEAPRAHRAVSITTV